MLFICACGHGGDLVRIKLAGIVQIQVCSVVAYERDTAVEPNFVGGWAGYLLERRLRRYATSQTTANVRS